MKAIISDNICVFDIEVSSVEITYKGKPMKVAFPYLGGFKYLGKHYIYRSMKDCVAFIDNLNKVYLSLQKTLVIWVHNLSYEFQFLKGYMKFDDVFAREPRHIMKATYGSIEFRCTYILSGSSLAKLAKNENLKSRKLEGDLDYELIRHEETPLSETESGYHIGDLDVTYEYVQKKIGQYGHIADIPLTQTGEVRYLFRTELEKQGKLEFIHDLCYKYSAKTLFLQNLLIRAYSGAYTHANYLHVGEILYDLFCKDYSSDYPYQMVARKFPTSWSIFTGDLDDILKYDFKDYAFVMDIELYDLHPKGCVSLLSAHKCSKIGHYVEDNGRIRAASYLMTSGTEQDLLNIIETYKFKSMVVSNVYISKKAYLPKEIVSIILKLFKEKTELKGIEAESENYMRSKQRINGVYGYSVFNILNSKALFDIDTGEWTKVSATQDDYIKFINKPDTILWYSIGVWVTAYARRMIVRPLNKLAENGVYSDTDSVKGMKAKRYKKWFEHLNMEIKTLFYDAMKHHKFDKEEYTFIDKKGVQHYMGIFEDEEPYTRFKTLGSKRYLVEYADGSMASTVAGAPKALYKFLGETNDEKFENFNDGFVLEDTPETHEYLRASHTYTDNLNINVMIQDYQGNWHYQNIRDGIHLKKSPFSMSISDPFKHFLKGNLDFLEGTSIYTYIFGQRQLNARPDNKMRVKK